MRQEIYPFTVVATPQNGVLTGTMAADLAVVSDPILDNILPEDGESIGANRLLVSWTSDSAGSTELFYRIAGDDQFNLMTGDSGHVHAVALTDLDWDTTYEWYVRTETQCGVSQSNVRSNAIEKGIVFEGEPYVFSIDRDYEQVRSIQVRNTDDNPHEVMLTIVNDNEQLVAGFRGDGSVDQSIVLQPGETQTVEIAFHAQDATQTEYQLTFKASADAQSFHPIINYAEVTVQVDQPDFNLTLEAVASDPYTLINTFRLTNNGDVLTDVRVFADDSSRPVLLFTPEIDHLRMVHGESIEFAVVCQ